MKFKITMKDPDGVYDCIKDAAADMAKNVTGVDDSERETIEEMKREKLLNLCGKWFKYSEYLTVEIDVDAETIRVCGKQ